MPCNSDYLEPSAREKELRRAAGLYFFVLTATNGAVPTKLISDANDIYCRGDYVADLCAAINGMDAQTLSRVVYDGRNPFSRDLADWWEEHLRVDANRNARAAEKAARENRDRLNNVAPDLLEVAQFVLEYHECGLKELTPEQVKKIRAAIARATGAA